MSRKSIREKEILRGLLCIFFGSIASCIPTGTGVELPMYLKFELLRVIVIMFFASSGQHIFHDAFGHMELSRLPCFHSPGQMRILVVFASVLVRKSYRMQANFNLLLELDSTPPLLSSTMLTLHVHCIWQIVAGCEACGFKFFS